MPLDSGDPESEEGTTYIETLDTPGVYRYFSDPHSPQDTYGAVVVERQETELEGETPFVARSTGGYVAFDRDSYADAQSPNFEFPDVNAGEVPIVIEGVIDESAGTWESTNVSFPESSVAGVDFQITAPDGLGGEIDRESGLLTANGTFEVVVAGDQSTSFQFDMPLTTGESGNLTGVGTYNAVNSTFLETNLVSNEYAITDQTGNTVVDDVLSLPAPDPDRNYAELGFEVALNETLSEEPTPTDAFVAESQGGLLAFDAKNESNARAEGFELPPSATVPEPIVVEGNLTGNTWESTNIEFPNLDSEAVLEKIGGDDLPINPEDVDVELSAPNGFSGTLDQTEMTLNGQLTIDIILGGQEVPITVTLNGTTGASGNLVGNISLSPESVSATIVDNQATVPALDEETFSLIGPIINDALGLPSAEGQTWLELPFRLSIGSDELPEKSEPDFVAESQGGLLALGAENESNARAEGFELPPSALSQEPVVIDAKVTGNEWQSTNIDFPDIDSQGLIDQFEGNPPIGPDQIDATLSAPDGFNGTLDQQEMTLEGQLNITITVSGQEYPIEIPIDGTTGESGSLTGDLDLSSDAVSATIVDNRATVPAPDSETFIGPVLNDALGLPSAEGQTWLELPLKLDDGSKEILPEPDFVARSTGGYVAFDKDSYANAQGGGLDIPDGSAGENPLAIWGVIDEQNGTWESTDVSIASIEQEGISAQVTTPGGLGGEIDRESGLFTLNGSFDLAIEGSPDTSFQFDMPLTTGQSGEITDAGEYSTVSSTFADVNLVSNEFAVTDQTGDTVVDSTLAVPSPDPSRNYAELGFGIEFDPGTPN